MAKKKKKGLFKKILKGVGIAAAIVGTIYTGGAAAGLIGGAAKIAGGAAKGTGLFAKIGGAAKGLFNRGKKLKTTVANLVTGKTKEVRTILKQEKAEAKAAAQQIENVKDLVAGGMSLEEAKSKLGLSDEILPGENTPDDYDAAADITGPASSVNGDMGTLKSSVGNVVGDFFKNLFTKEGLPKLLMIIAVIAFGFAVLRKKKR
jgi:hypothetical protein